MQSEFRKEKQQTTTELQALHTELQTVKAQLETTKAELEAVKAREKVLTEQLAAQSAQANIPDFDNSALVEAEVQRRIAEIQSQQVPPIQALPIDNAQEIEAEVQRRVAEVVANVDAEVQRRVEELRSTDNIEDGEVVDAGQPIPTPAEIDSAQGAAVVSQLSEEEVEARVNARVEEILPSRMDAVIEARIAEKEKAVDNRIKVAQAKFAEYKAAAVKKAVEDAETRHKATEKEYQKRISELEAEFSKLRVEISQLKAKISDLESRPAPNTGKITGIKQEDLNAALTAKDREHQSALVALQANENGRFEEAKEALRVEIQAEIMALQSAVDEAAGTAEGAATVNKEKEKLKALISRNVEHRLGKEKERWMQDIEAQRESLIEEKVQAALKEKLSELEAKMQEKEALLKAEMEKTKDAIRQEGVMRSKVQINMLERKNKALEEKIKATEGSQPAAQTLPTPISTTQASAPPQPPRTGIRRPSTIGTTIQPPNTQPQTPPTAAQIQAAQQAAIAAAEQAISAAPQSSQQQPRRAENQGTGPGALRQLRGALAGSGIPRSGIGAGRGRGGHQQTGSQAGSQAGSPQQAGMNPFAGVPLQVQATGIPNPFGGAQQQQPQQARGGGIPRARGVFGGRGRGGQQIQTTGMQQLPQQAAGSPTRGGMNPDARQFVPPGNKRGREAGDGDDVSGDGKRVRSSIGGPPPVVGQ